MQHEPAKFWEDILNAAQEILAFVGAKSFEDYSADALLKAAVERKFLVIGEATNRLAKLHPDLAERIRNWRRIVAFRNIVVHGYDVVDDGMVWDAVQNHLPLLIEDVEALRDG